MFANGSGKKVEFVIGTQGDTMNPKIGSASVSWGCSQEWGSRGGDPNFYPSFPLSDVPCFAPPVCGASTAPSKFFSLSAIRLSRWQG